VEDDDISVDCDTDETNHHRNICQRSSRQLKIKILTEM